ncbi:alanine dehydrogenase [Sulfobacillus harzensis]|uniref:Alanine dehydrogenase n=1 Tax=Sulfobacillus harzensis TaxID=2729629 RepID=A0A7Y0L6J6_9FIRM|nr:alanine dehydrogenase [Sulfobacillus harzensis]NMP24171.1 alanine dehydrogenase [Sulfobacillus harzensis]
MVIGVPKEIKTDENRVALTPAGALALTRDGHTVLVERGAGVGSGFTDKQYQSAGATVIPDSAEVWGKSQMVMKVKEPLVEEYRYFRSDLVLFTYLHLAPERELTDALLESGITAVAYETVQKADRSLPLLTPMSEVAGRMATQIGAQFLEKAYGGRGVLLGGVPGVLPGRVVVVGGGIVGTNAARIALGLGAEVTIIDINADRLRQLDDLFQGRIRTLMSNEYNIAEAVRTADLLVGAVLIPGARAPHLVSEEMVKSMPNGSVIVDVAIDQGGSIATIDRVTTHSHPTYEKYGVIHYAVANMPGAVARTSTLALTNVTLPYARLLAAHGAEDALRRDPALARGLNIYKGRVTFEAVAEAHHLPYVAPDAVLA